MKGALKLDFGEVTAPGSLAPGYRRGLRLATPFNGAQGRPEEYRILELKRRRAQIRARRVLGLV